MFKRFRKSRTKFDPSQMSFDFNRNVFELDAPTEAQKLFLKQKGFDAEQIKTKMDGILACDYARHGMTIRQASFLELLGVKINKSLTKLEASLLIGSELEKRQQKGLMLSA
jgi:hypothetical protein